MEDQRSPVQKVKMNCTHLFLFWCKEKYVDVTESLVDIIGSLLSCSPKDGWVFVIIDSTDRVQI